jgi:SecD/SecF fusion protein
LGRTINTAGSVIVVLLAIFILGGEIIRGFSFAMLVGTISGTYSTLFIATPLAYDIMRLKGKKKKK